MPLFGTLAAAEDPGTVGGETVQSGTRVGAHVHTHTGRLCSGFRTHSLAEDDRGRSPLSPAPPRPRAGLAATGQLLFCICLSLAYWPGFPESRSSRVCRQ